MRHSKLITAGILILTFVFINELQQSLFSKIKSAGNEVVQAELVALLLIDVERKEIEEEDKDAIEPYPQASVLTVMEKIAYKLMSVTRQSVTNIYWH